MAETKVEQVAKARRKEMDSWQPIETANLDRYSHVPCLVAEGSAVGEAMYHPTAKGWWWAGFDPTDHVDRRCFPQYWMPLPAPPGR